MPGSNSRGDCPACGQPKADHIGPSAPPRIKGFMGTTEDRPGACLTKTGRYPHKPSERVILLAQETLILEATEAICEVMQEQGVTRKELARRIGKSKGYVSQLLSGKRNMRLRTLADLATALDMELTVRPR